MWSTHLVAAVLAIGCLLAGLGVVSAHNNPGFKEVLLLTIDVHEQPLPGQPDASHSEPFALTLPKKTIELIWRIEDGAGDGITFAISQGDKLHADELVNGSNSRILRGDDIRVVNVKGAATAFRLQVFANVIDRSKKSES